MSPSSRSPFTGASSSSASSSSRTPIEDLPLTEINTEQDVADATDFLQNAILDAEVLDEEDCSDEGRTKEALQRLQEMREDENFDGEQQSASASLSS